MGGFRRERLFEINQLVFQMQRELRFAETGLSRRQGVVGGLHDHDGLEQIIESATGCRVTSIHNDVSTKTGEQVAIYVLDHNLEALLFRRSTEGAAAPRKVSPQSNDSSSD